ncbi:MAG: Rieske 2Fe-2S domain-containing protein [Actinomycetota bacterium]|nr:Rieske 2Fe-2S domain-containing protein [Actinomycetota bacterium]
MTTTDRGFDSEGSAVPDPERRAGLNRELDPTHFGIGVGEPWPEDVPRDQDDDWWRYQDDPKGARRAELRVAACWMLTMLAAVGLMIVFVAGGQAQAEGALLFVGFVSLGTGLILWARDLLPGHEITASRGHHDTSTVEERDSVVDSFTRVTEPVARRPFLFRMLGLVGGVFGLAFVFPLASLGKRPHTTLYNSGWAKGSRLVTEDKRPVRPSDLQPMSILTVFPENLVDQLDTAEAAQSSTVLINVGDARLKLPAKNQTWNVGSLVAFSKICTHAGCPVGLYNSQTHQLVCPCHQSTFDVLEACNPVFGPASRSLPQLPLTVDADGYLIAQSDYREAVGPGFWNRG